MFVEKVGTLSDKVFGYDTVPFGIECFLDEVALELADLPEENFEIGVGGGLVLGGKTHPLHVVHLKQKLCYLWFGCHLYISISMRVCMCMCVSLCE